MPSESAFLETLRKMVESSDSSRVDRKEFEALAKQLVDLFKTLTDKSSNEIKAMKQALDIATSRLEANNGQSVASIKSELMTTLDSHIKSMLATHEAKMAQVDEKMDSIVDGKDADEQKMMDEMMPKMTKDCVDKVEKDLPQLGSAIRDALELLPDGEKLKASAIEGLEDMEKRLNERISSITRGFGGGRSNNSTKFHDLSSLTDGNTKVFSVPKGLSAIVIGSDFPTVLMENNGFTLNSTRTQLTLTVTNAPSAGSQLLYQYTSIFN